MKILLLMALSFGIGYAASYFIYKPSKNSNHTGDARGTRSPKKDQIQ